MEGHRAGLLLPRLAAADLALCVRWNLDSRRRLARAFFAGVSKAGDGPAWLSLVVLLPALFGAAGVATVLELLLVAAVALPLARWLKHSTGRPRPYLVEPAIELGAAPLDRFSFPSGHTLHAAAISLTTVGAHPETGWVLAPFALLIAMSRVALGLHYPSDVAAGAAIGAAISLLIGMAV